MIPPLSPWWIPGLLALVFWLTPAREGAPGRSAVAILALFLLSFVFLSAWRSRVLHPSTSLGVSGAEALRPLETLRIERRNEIRRITGRRQNVEIHAQGVVEVERAGVYAIEISCDDFCEVTFGDEVFRAEGELARDVALPKGGVPLDIRYRQGSGPARLAISWDRPAFFEPLPLDYFVRAPGTAPRTRASAHLALVCLALWWGLFAFYWMRLARAKEGLRTSAAVLSLAALLVLYGGLLRLEAFLAHSGLSERSERAAVIHEALLPWLPSYGVFYPENAPEDPYRADVRSYLDRAEAMPSEGFYAPSFREPFYVALVSAFVGAAGGEIGILIESFVFSVLTLALFYFFAAKLHGRVWALALLVPVALHHWLVLDSPTGYRESAYSFFLLVFVAAVVLGGSRLPSAIVSGITGALLCLIRLSALSIVIPLAALRLFQVPANERLRYAGAFGVVFLLLVGPFLYSNLRAHGDPFYSVSFHTEFWLRAEGVDQGQGPVSLSRYFTDFERAGELLKGTLLGLTVLPLRTFANGLGDFPVLALLTLGLGALGLARGRNLYLTAAYFGHLVAFAYIQNFPSGEMPRFVMPAFYLLVLAIPFAIRLRRSVLAPIDTVNTEGSPGSR
jgi:hypothetical protein